MPVEPVTPTHRVKVGRKFYPAYHDQRGVLRFVPNRIMRRLVDETTRQFEARIPTYDLNQLALDHARGLYTLEEMIDFYTGINYSVGGFCDVLGSLLEQDAELQGLERPRTMSVRVYAPGEAPVTY